MEVKNIQVEVIKYGEKSVNVKVALVNEQRGVIGTMVELHAFKKGEGYSMLTYLLRGLRAEVSKGLNEKQVERLKDKISEIADRMKAGTKEVHVLRLSEEGSCLIDCIDC